MSLLYRHHRGGLSTSMRTVREVHTLVELVAYIQGDNEHLTIKAIKWEHQGPDDRIGWETYMVCATTVNRSGQEYTIPVGFADRPLNHLPIGVTDAS